MKKSTSSITAAIGLLVVSAALVRTQVPPGFDPIGANPRTPRLMENLNRGVIAMRTGTTAYVGWRMLGTDPPDVAFNLYRTTGGGAPIMLNSTPITTTTDYVDTDVDFTQSNAYHVRPVVAGVELAPSETYTLPANVPTRQYLSIPIQRPSGGVNKGGANFTYNANDGSIGDLDGDGQYEIVLKWEPSDARDNASTGYSGPTILDAYKRDGTRMWRINLGFNIRSGAHYTQFMVYDLDGDGKAEVAVKTADGTADGLGNVIGDPDADYVSRDSATRGKVLVGPEYFTIFDGQTGGALVTTDYVPSRDPLGGWGGVGGNCNNDSNGNRADRFLAAVAYLDGIRPSVIMARGYYGRSVLAAWDWRDGQLTQRWVYDSVDRNNPFSGQGNHNLSVADVDGDGKDEIVYGSMVVDDDGTGLFTTQLRHGDAMHVSDLLPSRPGLEVWGIHENEATSCGTPGKDFGAALYDAATGEIIFGVSPRSDVGRGMAADLNPDNPGYEFWGGGSGLMDAAGNRISAAPSTTNFAVWWDADLLRELEDGTSVTKYNYTTGSTTTLLSASDSASNNGTKSTPVLSGDILGDWREEVIWRASDNLSLRIYTTTIPAANRFYTLLHDSQYRLALAWQNVAYNQPPHPSFFLGSGMSPQPTPDIITELDRTPPVLSLPGNITLEAIGPEGAVATYTASAWDEVSGNVPVSLSILSGSTFPLGATTVAATATDSYGNTATGSFTVTVVDTTPPNIASVQATPSVLWPPNGKMVPITLAVSASDLVGTPACLITQVTSNEAPLAAGAGQTAVDWLITGPLTLQLRAERSGRGTGRTYTITVVCRDPSGNSSSVNGTVVVPHDQGR